MRAVAEPEPVKKPEEEDPQALVAAEMAASNSKTNASSNAKVKVEPPAPPPYRYAMPTHSVYSPPPIKVKRFHFVSLCFFLSLFLSLLICRLIVFKVSKIGFENVALQFFFVNCLNF